MHTVERMSTGDIVIVYDYLDEGYLLSNALRTPDTDVTVQLGETTAAMLLFQLLKAVQCLHESQLVHGRIALDTIYINRGMLEKDELEITLGAIDGCKRF